MVLSIATKMTSKLQKLGSVLLRRRCAASVRTAVAALSLALLLSLTAVGVAAGPRTVNGSSGAFETVLPNGWANDTASYSEGAAKLDLLIAAPSSGGFAVNINVVRHRTTTTNVAAVAESQLAYLKHHIQAHAFSTLQTLSIDGATARSFDYLTSTSAGTSLHQLQVYVIHDGSAYAITYSALSSGQYRGSLPVLHQVLAGWRWL
jgi:hypothetical protein